MRCKAALQKAVELVPWAKTRLEEALAAQINRVTGYSFETTEYMNQLERLEKGESLGSLDRFEKIAALYTHSLRDLHPTSQSSDGVFKAESLYRKTRLMFLMTPLMRNGSFSEWQNDRIIHLLMLPNDPVSLNLFEALSAKKIRIRTDQHIRKRFMLAVAQGKTLRAFEALGAVRGKNWIERSFDLTQNGAFNFVLNHTFNVLSLRNGFIVMPPSRKLPFSKHEIEKAIRDGIPGALASVRARVGERARHELIYELTSQWTARVSLIVAALVTASIMIEFEEKQIEALSKWIDEAEIERLKPEQERLFELWLKAEESRIGTRLDPSDPRYIVARGIFIEVPLED